MKETNKIPLPRLILLIVISVLWIAGLVLLFLDKVGLGLVLWGVGLLGGLIVFFTSRNRETLNEVISAETEANKKDDE
ncbi:MAG: hypothetical protein IKI24_04025 [Clostridia bacterium]|jgi:Zn-dependent protease with chaperone function|nr:hypothetical protein [Clostridia bacterium]MCR4578564.1 hypothetical protein [Clostridiales bacterium]